MRLLALAVLLACCGCSEPPNSQIAPTPQPETVIPGHVLPAFEGQLVGTDRGEWIGKLTFQDAAGNLKTLLNENVHGIVQNPAGIFVFTGLAHMDVNDGYIYEVAQGASDHVQTTLLGRLPGAPTQVSPKPDGSTTFLVYSGYSGNRGLFECYSLTGKVVKRAYDCLPPKAAGL